MQRSLTFGLFDLRSIIDVFPDLHSLGGIGDLEAAIGVMLTIVLIVAVLMIIVSSIIWAIYSSTGSPVLASKGKTGVLVAVGAATLAGCSVD